MGVKLRTQNSKLKTQNLPAALMLLVFGVYLLTMSGHVYSPDEETMLALSRSLVERGSWAMEPQGGLFQVEGVGGKLYSEKGPGQSFFAMPWTALGLLLGNAYSGPQSDFVLQFVLGAYNALIGAGIAGLMAALALAMGYSRWAALFVGAALAFATFLWPTSRTFFAEPLLGLLMLAAFYLLYLGLKREGGADTKLLILSGALFAIAVAVKVQGAIALPAYLLYIALRSRQWSVVGGQWSVIPHSALRTLHSALPWLAGLGAGIAPYLFYNWLAFGGPLATGYGYGTSVSNFDTPLYVGVYGLLLSPGKGLILYAPPVLLALWGWGRFARRHGAEAWFVGALTVIMLVVFGSFKVWHGDGAWGPRFLAPLLPFLLLPTLPVIQRALTTPNRPHQPPATNHRPPPPNPLPRLALAAIFTIGFFVNLLGVLVNFDTYLNVGYNDQTRHWQPHASPIAGHFNLLNLRLRGTALRAMPQPNTAYLTGGFSYSEGNLAQGNLLPRWTYGEGTLELLTGAEPVPVTLRIADHRPPQLPRANVSIIVNDTPVEVETQPVAERPASTDYTFEVNSSPALVVIRSDTWNPSEQPGGSHDEELGVSLERVAFAGSERGTAPTLVEAMPTPDYYPALLWYYDLRTPFAADLWPVYMAEAKMGERGLLLALPVALIGLACLGAGVWGLRDRRAE